MTTTAIGASEKDGANLASQPAPCTMKIECPNCGSDIPDLPNGTTEHQARLALRAVLLWYAESPIREIQMANEMCGMRFPIREIEAVLPVPKKVSKHQPGGLGGSVDF